jgi:hypothetical protein
MDMANACLSFSIFLSEAASVSASVAENTVDEAKKALASNNRGSNFILHTKLIEPAG